MKATKDKNKICSKCGEEKSLSDFSKDKKTKDKLSYICKECSNKNSKNHYLKYSEDKKEKAKKWYLDNKDKKNIYRKEYYKQNTLEEKKLVKLYQQSPKGKAVRANYNHKRRIQCKITDITTDWLLEFKEKSIHCEICSCEMNDIRWHPQSKHLDHIIPLGKGGTHTMDNVRYICQTCNLSRPKNGSDLIKYKEVA